MTHTEQHESKFSKSLTPSEKENMLEAMANPPEPTEKHQEDLAAARELLEF